MYSITVDNVNQALPVAMALLRDGGVRIAPRAGQWTREYPEPVATTYLFPTERVLFDPARDANPFFHFFEALWILAGRNDVAFLARFNAKMADYSDDGKTFHAPYGERLRKCEPLSNDLQGDQVVAACQHLKVEPDTRRVVLQIWNYELDLGTMTKDLPCNDMVFCKVRDNKLNIRVLCRSNDVVWGAYGANVVQFSMLQEYMAAHIGCNVGTYTQFSDSFHVYEDVKFVTDWFTKYPAGVPTPYDPYSPDSLERVAPYKLFADVVNFDLDLKQFFRLWDANAEAPLFRGYRTEAFVNVVLPLYVAHAMYKAGSHLHAMRELQQCMALDWKSAATQWVLRRAKMSGNA